MHINNFISDIFNLFCLPSPLDYFWKNISWYFVYYLNRFLKFYNKDCLSGTRMSFQNFYWPEMTFWVRHKAFLFGIVIHILQCQFDYAQTRSFLTEQRTESIAILLTTMLSPKHELSKGRGNGAEHGRYATMFAVLACICCCAEYGWSIFVENTVN